MTTQTMNGVSPSLLESGFHAIGRARARRPRKQGPGLLRRAWGAVSGLLGTVAALVCLAIAGFGLGFFIGMAGVGLALLLLDTKVTLVQRARAQERRQ